MNKTTAAEVLLLSVLICACAGQQHSQSDQSVRAMQAVRDEVSRVVPDVERREELLATFDHYEEELRTFSRTVSALQSQLQTLFRRQQRRVGNRHDLFVIAMHDEYGNVDRLEVFGEVCFGERLDAFVVCIGGAHHGLAPPIVDHSLRYLRAGAIEAVERTRRKLAVELCTVRSERSAKTIEDFDRQPARIFG